MQETPTSDFESFGGITPEDPPTPTTPTAQFQPKYRVRVSEPEKNGETIAFSILTSEVTDNTEFKVKREYEDFEWFHHCLFNNVETAGIVVPPLPRKPVIESQANSSLNVSSEKSMMADQYQNDCRGLEKYLHHLVSHQVFGKYQSLEAFLINEKAPFKSKLKKSIFGKLTSAVDTARKANHKDIDNYFQKQRDLAVKYTVDLNEVNQCFNKVLASEKKIASGYGHLSTTLSMGGSHQLKGSTSNQKSNMLLVKFGDVMEDAQHFTTVDYKNDNTLAFHLDYALRYAEALKEMFYRRTCLLVAYEDCNRTLAKAKPNKQEAAAETKVAAERALDECTEVARREIITFHERRILSFQEALVTYTEAKIKTARDAYAVLMKSLVQFKQIDL